MPRLKHKPPKYRLHKASGQAVVTVNRRTVYLGKFDSPESHELYNELIECWRKDVAARDALEQEAAAREETQKKLNVTLRSLYERRQSGHPVTFNELVLCYNEHAESEYRKNGEITREAGHIREVLRFARKKHGRMEAEKFGPLCLKELREEMVSELDWSRDYLNKQVGRIRRMFRWAVENELIEPAVYQKLMAVRGLKKGKTAARETKGVACVDDAIVEQTIEHLPEVIADMVRLQRLTSARPGEICSIRPCDIDRSGDVWIYTPSSHKTEHHEIGRIVLIGPRGQEVLTPYLLRAAEDFCFRPADSERKRFARLSAKRTTPLRPRDKRGAARRAARLYAPRYVTDTYRRAINRTCKRRGIPPWSPNRLRHTAATEIRRKHGLEGAQVICGHQSADVTQVYAERDIELAKKIMRDVG